MLALLLLATGTARSAPDPGSDAPPVPAEELPIVEGPAVLAYVEAPYPAEARAQGLEGAVTMRVTLSDQGEIDEVEVIGPAGHGFDEAAVDAVLAMTWAPARTVEGPVGVVFEFTYHFVLEAEEPAPEAPDPELPVNLEGVVLQMATRDPLEGVVVGVVGADLTATTDAEGRFALRGVPTGAVELHLVHVGHATEDKVVEVVEGEVTAVRLWMRADAYRENESVAIYDRPKDEATRRTLSIQEIRRVPGTFGDPIRVVQTLPGAARPPFGTGLLVIRGADPEDSGVYIDGIRIPIIYHLTGTTSVLQPDLIESVDYLPGGYGVEYGRTMGGTVDVKTRTDFDDGGVITWGTDILDSQVLYQGKPGKRKNHGLAVGVRRSYVDLFVPFFLPRDSGFVLEPRYWDYQLKWAPFLDAKTDVSAFVYGFDDVLRAATPQGVAQGSDQDTQGDLSVRYGSHRLVVKVRHPISDTLAVEIVPSVGVDGTDSSLGAEFGITNTNLIGQLRAQLPWRPRPAVELVPGLDFLGGAWRFEFVSAFDVAAFDDPLAEREPVGFDGRGSFFSPDVFLEANLRPLEGSDRWLVNPGIRLDVVTLDSNGGVAGEGGDLPVSVSTAVDPRVLTRLQVVPDKLALKAATGLYHQPPQPYEAVGVGTAASVGFERSWSTSLGWEHGLGQALSYDVDLFYRRMDQLVVYDEAWSGFGSNPFFNGGEGRAYGMEVILRHEPVGRLFGWVSYTLSRATRRDPFACDPTAGGLRRGEEDDLLGTGGCWYPFDFDQTHIFSAQGGYDLPHDFGVSLQVQLVTGNPADTYDTGVYDADADFYNGLQVGGWNAERLPPFFQTSLRFDKLWTFRHWQLETYVDLLNAVRGVNPEFTVYNYDYTEHAYIRGLPFIPNVGVEAKFFP